MLEPSHSSHLSGGSLAGYRTVRAQAAPRLVSTQEASQTLVLVAHARATTSEIARSPLTDMQACFAVSHPPATATLPAAHPPCRFSSLVSCASDIQPYVSALPASRQNHLLQRLRERLPGKWGAGKLFKSEKGSTGEDGTFGNGEGQAVSLPVLRQVISVEMIAANAGVTAGMSEEGEAMCKVSSRRW